MASAYDDLMPSAVMPQEQATPQAASSYDDLFPADTAVGYHRGRWQGKRPPPPSLSGALQAFAEELRAQIGNVGRGLGQAYVETPLWHVGEMLGGNAGQTRDQVRERLAAEDAAADVESAARSTEHPMATGMAQGAPYALMPQRALPALAAGALWEGLKYGSPGERAGEAAKGAALSGLGNMAGNLARFSIQPAAPTSSRLGLQGAAGRLGAPLTAGQASGDARTLAFEDYLRQTPFGSIPLDRVANQQATAVNRAAAASMGETAEKLTADVLGSAKARLGRAYDDIQVRNALRPHPEIAQELRDFRATLKTDVEPAIAARLEAQIAKFTEKLKDNGGALPGKVFQSLQSQLGDVVSGGGQLGHYAKLLKDIFKRGMDRSISTADRAAWDQTNEQYRNWKRLIDKAFAVNTETGMVNPKADARMLESEGSAFQTGAMRGPMADVASFGRGMPSTATGSQTAPRYFFNELRNNPVGGLLGGIPDYAAAALLARGGLVNMAPWLQQPLAAGLGYMGRGAVPGFIQGAFNQ